VALLGVVGLEFLDDLAYLVAENDLRSSLIVSELLIASASALWAVSCCAVALGRRLVLYWRGL
jgi:hypothetical protein